MSNYKELRQFTTEELLFNEGETRIILKFIFDPTHHDFIDSLPMDDHLRGFTQGLLVEAIDASYAVGYVKGLLESVTNPVKGARKIIKTFGIKASQHWFKHASVHDKQNIKIYDFVKKKVAKNFIRHLQLLVTKTESNEKPGAFSAYNIPSHGAVILRG